MKGKLVNPLVMKGNADVVTRQLRLLLFKEVDQRCELCNKPLRKRFEVHHKDGCGLNWRRDNLMVLCVPCHKYVTMESDQTKRSKELSLDWSKPASLPFEEVRRQYIAFHPRA